MKFDDTEIEEHKFHQNKNTILIKDVDMDKTVVSNNFLLVKKILNISLVTKIIKQLDPDAYSFQKFGLKDIVTEPHIFIL